MIRRKASRKFRVNSNHCQRKYEHMIFMTLFNSYYICSINICCGKSYWLYLLHPGLVSNYNYRGDPGLVSDYKYPGDPGLVSEYNYPGDPGSVTTTILGTQGQ